VIEHALEDYKRDLGSFDARIQMRFSFPMKVTSLRSGLSGWQYYDIALELVDVAGCASGSCTWITSIPAPAPARWN
jgi:GTP cyclohydrolase I